MKDDVDGFPPIIDSRRTPVDTTITPDHRLRPLLVMAWRDPVVDALGFDPRSTNAALQGSVERFFLSLKRRRNPP